MYLSIYILVNKLISFKNFKKISPASYFIDVGSEYITN